MSCAYCKNITVCAICGKGYAEAVRADAQRECKACHGDGYTNEGDPEIGNALFDCTACGGSGFVPAGALPTLPAVAVAAAVPQPQMPGELPRHQFWGAGEPDCPPELKASNGELHTARCKVCGDGWRKSINVCMAALHSDVQARLDDALAVLRMVDDNHRVDAGERRKAWHGPFVVREVRRVLDANAGMQEKAG